MGKTRSNDAIAQTVDQLLMWGFSGRGEVFEAVGEAARTVLHRTFAEGNTSLGPDRIEQIWEEYRPPGWEQFWEEPWPDGMRPILKRRWLYTKRGLRRSVPDPTASVLKLAETLLRNGGRWPWPTEKVWHPVEGKWEDEEIDVSHGEPEPSPKWEAQIKQMPILGRRKK